MYPVRVKKIIGCLPALLCALSIHTATLLSGELAKPFYYEFKGEISTGVWTTNPYSLDATKFSVSSIAAGPRFTSLRASVLPENTRGFSYCGGELATNRFFTYGRFTVRMRPRIVPGVVGSFFLMSEWRDGHWLHKEIDIEFLGKSVNDVQFNVHRFYQDTESAAGTPYIYKSTFDYTRKFHNYSILWMPKKIEWFVDGVKVYEYSGKVPDEPLKIRMNCWVPETNKQWAADWAGSLDGKTLPCYVDYEWVRYEP
jgi:beta-glucanase (GH16 family)